MEVKVGKDGNPVAYLSPPGSPGRGQPQPGMNAIGFAGTPAASPSPLPHQVKDHAMIFPPNLHILISFGSLPQVLKLKKYRIWLWLNLESWR